MLSKRGQEYKNWVDKRDKYLSKFYSKEKISSMGETAKNLMITTKQANDIWNKAIGNYPKQNFYV